MFGLGVLSLVIWIVLIFAHGDFWRVRLPAASPLPAHWPSVVAVIPARNEADVLEEALGSVLGQNYPGELVAFLVDDHSTDETAQIAQAMAKRSGKGGLHVIAARDLPSGWTGKVWAQAEGVAAAATQAPGAAYIWFTDADIRHGPDALEALVARAIDQDYVLTSLMVRLNCASFAEKALIPAFVLFFAMLYPFAWVNKPRARTAAAAGGCMLVSRNALARVGGMAAIADAVIDDCALARVLKRVGTIRLDLADSSVSLRQYPRWQSIGNMISRSAYTQLHYSFWLLLATCLGLGVTFGVPPLLSLTGASGAGPALAAWGLMCLSYVPLLRYYDRSIAWAPLLPLVALFYVLATLESARRYWLGQGAQWKGRSQAPLRD